MAAAERGSAMLSLDRLAIPATMVSAIVATSVAIASYLGGRIGDIEHQVAMLRRDIALATVAVDGGVSEARLRAWIELARARGVALPDLPGR